MMMMQMYFHFRLNEYILFKEWLPGSVFVYVLSCLGVASISFIYEALRSQRAVLFQKKNADSCCAPTASNPIGSGASAPSEPECNCGEGTIVSGSNEPLTQTTQIKLPFLPEFLLSRVHMLQTTLYFLQMFLSYSLMMISMTYNVPIVTSMILGHVTGYLLFGPLYDTVEEAKLCDCCG